MLFTHFILLISACLSSAAHLQNHAYLHRNGAAGSSLSSPLSPRSNLAASSSADDDEQDDCDAEYDTDESGEKSSEITVVSNPVVDFGSGGASASSSSTSASASGSQSSTPDSNNGISTNENDAQSQNQNQGQLSSSTSAPASAVQSASSTAPAPSATTSSPSSPNSGTVTEQKDAAQVAGANQNVNIQVAQSSSSSTAPATSSTPSTSAAESGGSTGTSFTASFTEYGSDDQHGSSNCNTASAACGFYNNPGYNAAISQAVFGKGPGQGAGPACGTCYKLMPDAPSAKSIIVKVNNLCPDDGNALCSAPEGVDVNFDLCKDDGAAAGLFGEAGPFQVNGTAVLLDDCSGWGGGADLTS